LWGRSTYDTEGGVPAMRDDSERAGWGELLEKTVELSLGAVLLTKDAATKVIEDLVKRGAMTREEGGKLVSDMMEKGKLQKEKMEEFVAEVVERALARADVARRSSVEELEKRVVELERRSSGG